MQIHHCSSKTLPSLPFLKISLSFFQQDVCHSLQSKIYVSCYMAAGKYKTITIRVPDGGKERNKQTNTFWVTFSLRDFKGQACYVSRPDVPPKVPTHPSATERKIEWLLAKTGKEHLFQINLVLLPMASCKAFAKLAVP